ncbi:MAG: Rv3717 family N-acetylmuramoyl-L-alanine amidase [Mycobacteriaceae bacterium]|nr:Rv3717 family N-acetylmuramoyl-L-alanine amidase [Mycobacteriaceae bacterium]
MPDGKVIHRDTTRENAVRIRPSACRRLTSRCARYRGSVHSPSRRDVLRYAAVTPVFLGLAPVALSTPTASAAGTIAGKIVFLDPGHNGANDASINRQVTNGRGGTKECQTSGTTTDSGYPEHSFNWDVVLRIRAELMQLGVRTVMSRGDDSALGPCVDQRAAMANALHPDAIVSIHADGGPPDGRGFHVNYSSPPLNDAQSGPAVRFAQVMRDQLVAAGFTPSTYRGSDGLYGRADLAGLNLAQYPSILIECGNMKNAGEAAVMVTADGRAKYASAVGQGISAYLSQV